MMPWDTKKKIKDLNIYSGIYRYLYTIDTSLFNVIYYIVVLEKLYLNYMILLLLIIYRIIIIRITLRHPGILESYRFSILT